MRRPLGLVTAFLIVAFSGRSGVPRTPFPPAAVSLVRVGTIGDFPPVDLTTVIEVDAGGVITIDGRVLALEAIPAFLGPLADRDRHRSPCCPSRRYVVLRLDRTLPWGVAHALIRKCAYGDVRIHRIHFAVLPESGGEEEGTLAMHRPLDHGLGVRIRSVRNHARLVSGGIGSSPTALYWALRRERERVEIAEVGPRWSARASTLCVDRFVPVGFVLQAVDAFHRTGTGEVLLSPAPSPGGIEDLLREARPRIGSSTISVVLNWEDDELVPARGRPMPPEARIRGGFAGTAPSRPLARPVRAGAAHDAEVCTAEAISLGLRWLLWHQDPEGCWDSDGFQAQCRLGRCDGPGRADGDPAVTGLALLTFLGAGNTHIHGRHRSAVRSSLKWLKHAQGEDGCFGSRASGRYLVNHAIATWAMVLTYSRTGSPLFRRSSVKAIDFLVRNRNADPGAWICIFMALETAARSGRLHVPEEALEDARTRVAEADDRGGRWAAMLVLLARGEDPERSAALDIVDLPRWDEASGSVDMPSWFLGSAAVSRIGDGSWAAWNAALVREVAGNQSREGEASGSWDPIGPWARDGGRVASTALMTACLLVSLDHGRVWE